MKKLRADYEAWWEDIKPAFKKYSRIIVGNPAENPATLTSHDWLTTGDPTPWNQQHIRKGIPSNGVWAIKVDSAGKYKISLRRWPRESGKVSDTALPPGAPVPGMKAFREQPGKGFDIAKVGLVAGEQKQEVTFTAGAQETTFEMDLKAGPLELEGYFILKDGGKVGTYYVYFEKL